MRFWDASAVVPLLIEETTSAAVLAIVDTDPHLVVWWGTEVECVSAITRRERDGAFDPSQVTTATSRLRSLAEAWREVDPSSTVRHTAVRLLRTHQLRAGDALQLAAAIVAADGDPGTLAFVTLDDRLAVAASREGFPIVIPA